MLDDSNVLNQFGVQDYQEVIAEQLAALFVDVDLGKLDKNRLEIDQIFLVSEGRQNLDFMFIKNLIDSQMSSLISPINLVYKLNSRHLTKCSLVIFEADWHDQPNLNRMIRQARRKQSGVVRLDDFADLPPITVVLHWLVRYQVVGRRILSDLAGLKNWLEASLKQWSWRRTVDKNLAKQLALAIVGKTALILPSIEAESVAANLKSALGNLAYNLAFVEPIADLMRDGGVAWKSHPVEKPFAVLDMVTEIDSPLERQHFLAKNRFLSGQMPASYLVKLKGQTPLEIMLYGWLLAQMVAVYLATLNKQSLRVLVDN